MAIFIFYILLAIVAGVAANARGRSFIGWTLISLLVSPLIGLLLVLVMNRVEAPVKTAEAAPAPLTQPKAGMTALERIAADNKLRMEPRD